MNTTQPLSDLQHMIIEHVMPIIATLSRDQPHLAKQMFAEEVWIAAPTMYGLQISLLAATHRLPLRFHEKTTSNASTYWITLD